MTIDEKMAKIFCRSCVVKTSYCKEGDRKKGFMCNHLKSFLEDNKHTILEEIENLHSYIAIEFGEDDSGLTHSTDMGDSVLIEDVQKLLG